MLTSTPWMAIRPCATAMPMPVDTRASSAPMTSRNEITMMVMITNTAHGISRRISLWVVS